MSKWKKKPVVIDAVQWTGANLREILEFIGATYALEGIPYEVMEHFVDEHGLHISTLEGDMRANEGDFIIRGVKGEYYPCKPDIFYATYEPVEE